jgi:DNA-binding response OmpR family regulator
VARVLVVDDEPRIVSFVSRALSAEGFQVDGAYDGIRALELASSGSYELVVLDLLLPHLDGMSVLQGLMETRPDQRVLVLSALSDVETKVRCLEFGASDYLSKPF